MNMEKEKVETGAETKEEIGAKTAAAAQRRTAFRPGTRKLVQLYAALLYNANLKGFIDGHIYTGPLKSACVPGFNCYSCPGAIASCPLGALQNALNASWHTAPWYMLGILSLFGVILGRTICGWLCPLGLIQELLHKIPVPKIKKSVATRGLSYLKYVFLVVFAIAIPIWYGFNQHIPVPGFCKYICPAGTLEGAVGLLQNEANATSFYQLKILFTRKWVIMLIIGLACAFCYRSFCRFLCPLGAIYGFFNRFSLTGVRVDHDRCNGCGLCVRQCQMDVKHVGDHECISCGKCMDSCAQGAISLKAGKITLAGPAAGKNADPEDVILKRRLRGRIAWGIAIAVLLFALAWFNWIEPAMEAGQAASSSGQPQPEQTAVLAESEQTAGSEKRAAQALTEAGENGAQTGNEAEPAKAAVKETESAKAEAKESKSSETAAKETKSAKATAKETESAGDAAKESKSDEKTSGDSAGAAGPAPAGESTGSGKVGTEVGDILPDFETELLGGGDFHLADHRGQVVIINMWATTCAPCIEELPYYEQLKQAQPDVEILALHNRMGAKKAEAFLADKGWDHIDFALDSKEKGLYALLGASDAMPSTIVLNKQGEITYYVQAPLTYEQLEALVEQAS